MKFYKIWRTYSWVYSGHNDWRLAELELFEFLILLFDSFVSRLNVTSLKRLPGMGITHVRWKTIISRLAVVS